MILRQPRYAKEEFARCRNEIYERDIRPRVASRDEGKFVAIDVETGEWEMAVDALAACERLIDRLPDSQTRLLRVRLPLRAPRRRTTPSGGITGVVSTESEAAIRLSFYI